MFSPYRKIFKYLTLFLSLTFLSCGGGGGNVALESENNPLIINNEIPENTDNKKDTNYHIFSDKSIITFESDVFRSMLLIKPD